MSAPAPSGYRPSGTSRDEAFTEAGVPRGPYAPVLAALSAADPGAVAESIAAQSATDEVFHGIGEGRHPLAVDAVPRVFAAAEWAGLEAGLLQRVRALDLFVADVFGAQGAVRDGVVPRELLEACLYYEEDLVGLEAPVRIGVAGPDLVRGPDGAFVVLEDNVRTPTMAAYAVWAREAVRSRLPAGPEPRPIAGALRDALAATLRRAAPDREDPVVAILSGGEEDIVLWEVRRLGALLDVPVVELSGLAARGDRLVLAEDDRAVDVLFRRTPEERLRDDAGRLNALGEALHGPLMAGTLRVVNAFGTGVADDKRTYPYVEDLVRYFLGEEPTLRSVPSYDLGRDDHRAEALERMDELVFKPRSGSGGYGVTLGPRASASELAALRAAVSADPHGWLAQELVAFSTHPTVVDGRLAPRHTDLRPFVFAAEDGFRVLPGGLSRFALAEGDMVVNCSQGGGGKDTWVLPQEGAGQGASSA